MHLKGHHLRTLWMSGRLLDNMYICYILVMRSLIPIIIIFIIIIVVVVVVVVIVAVVIVAVVVVVYYLSMQSIK